jgi:hypothetical protein
MTHKFGGKSKTYKATHGLLDRIDHPPRSFYNRAFSIGSKHDFDDQFFLLATVPTGSKNGALRCRRDYRKRQKNVKKFYWTYLLIWRWHDQLFRNICIKLS